MAFARLPLTARHCMGTGGVAFAETNGPVAQWLEPTAHNGLVGGSSPPGPTMISFEFFPSLCRADQ